MSRWYAGTATALVGRKDYTLWQWRVQDDVCMPASKKTSPYFTRHVDKRPDGRTFTSVYRQLNDKQRVKSSETTTTNGAHADQALVQRQRRYSNWPPDTPSVRPEVSAMPLSWHRVRRKTRGHRRNLAEQANIAARNTRHEDRAALKRRPSRLLLLDRPTINWKVAQLMSARRSARLAAVWQQTIIESSLDRVCWYGETCFFSRSVET